MPDDTFASADELAARLGVMFTDDETARAAILLGIVTAEIQDIADQTVFLVENDVLTMRGTTDERVALPQRPVVSVASVVLDGVPMAEGVDWILDGDVIARIPATTMFSLNGLLDQDGFLFPIGVGFGWEKQQLVVTYTHGYATPPARLKGICLETCVRAWVNPGSVARESIGDTSTVYDNMRFSPSGILLNDFERKQIKKLFGYRVRSLSIGGGV